MIFWLAYVAVVVSAAQEDNRTAIAYVWDDDVAIFERRLDDYKKPAEQDSSRDCFRVAQRIRRSYSAETGQGCMGCDPTVGFPDELCPTPEGWSQPCQDLVDQLYKACKAKKHAWPVPDEKAKTMPDGYYFDPEDTIKGTWGKSVEAAVKIAVEKCGCDAGVRTRPPLALTLALAWMVRIMSRR